MMGTRLQAILIALLLHWAYPSIVGNLAALNFLCWLWSQCHWVVLTCIVVRLNFPAGRHQGKSKLRNGAWFARPWAGQSSRQCWAGVQPRAVEGCWIWANRNCYIISPVVCLWVSCGFSCWRVILCGTTSASLQQWCRHVLKMAWRTNPSSPLLGTPQVFCKACWSMEISTTTSVSTHSSRILLLKREQFESSVTSENPQ